MNRLYTFFFLLSPILGSAKDLGTHSNVFPIVEQDILKFVGQKLNVISNTYCNASQLEKPISLNNQDKKLPPAKKPRRFTFDPTFILEKEIQDADGKVLFAKGESFNPLAKVKLTTKLLFIDVEDQRQMDWAAAQKDPCKIINVGCNQPELETKKSSSIYCDQGGFLTAKLGIKAVPAVAQQDGLVLLIEEGFLEAAKK